MSKPPNHISQQSQALTPLPLRPAILPTLEPLPSVLEQTQQMLSWSQYRGATHVPVPAQVVPVLGESTPHVPIFPP